MLIQRYGGIILVSALLDLQSANPKDRPVVIVTPEDRIVGGESIEGVAISTLIPNPIPSDHVLLPWHRQRHPRTGLNKRCAAVCSWLATIEEDRIIRSVGFVPGRQLREIAIILDRLKGEEGDSTSR